MSTDPREQRISYDLSKVDFPWIQQQKSAKELKQALRALQQDGCFPHLEDAVKERLKDLDPAFKRMMEQKPLSPEEQQALDHDIDSFLADIQKTDQQLRGTNDDGIFAEIPSNGQAAIVTIEQ